jgi:hypothetical protein
MRSDVLIVVWGKMGLCYASSWSGCGVSTASLRLEG